MNILIINGNPKEGGFIGRAVEIAMDRLFGQKINSEIIPLRNAKIQDCAGCFHCLRTGSCTLKDDMDIIVPKMLAADGYVMASAVRNADVTACYKRFYERITYRLGFPLLLEDKHTLAISAVGFMGGKSINRRMLGLQDVCHTRLSAHLHFVVGIPTKSMEKRQASRIEAAVTSLVADIRSQKGRALTQSAAFAFDRFIMRRFIFSKNEAVYNNVIQSWKNKGYISNLKT